MSKEDTDPTSFGNLARVFGSDVTGTHVVQALKLQKERPELRLGDAMVELGTLTEDEREAIVKAQERLQQGRGNRKDVKAMLAYATYKVRQMLKR